MGKRLRRLLLNKSRKAIIDHFLAFLLDFFIWTYIFLVCHKVIYQRYILNLRYINLNWNEVFIATLSGAVVGFLLISTPLSIGRVVKGIYKRDENKLLVKEPFFILGIFVLILTTIVGINTTEVSLKEFLSSEGIAGAKRIFSALLSPNLEILDLAITKGIETIYIAFMATLLPLPAAFFLGFFASRNLTDSNIITRILYVIIRFLLNITRSIEPLVWAVIFSVWVGIGPFAGMLALCFHTIASLAKLYSEQIESVSEGPIEAMKAVGAHPIQVVWYGVVPQIILPYLSFTIYRWDINVRMATIIGLVGGGGIGSLLMQYQGLGRWNEVGLLFIIIASIVWIMDWASSRIRESIK